MLRFGIRPGQEFICSVNLFGLSLPFENNLNPNDMIQIRTFTHRLAVSVLTLFTLASAACDKNEDSEPELELSLQGMAGQYAGTFNFIPTSFSSGNLNENSRPEIGLAVSFEVTPDGVLHFPNFPIEPLVEAILGEEASEEVLAQIGTISYDANLVRISSDGTPLSASLTTPVLRINIGTEAVITIESPKPLTFSKQGMLQFSLKAVKYWTDNTEASTRNDEWRFTAQKQ